jgi:hypothetical protein
MLEHCVYVCACVRASAHVRIYFYVGVIGNFDVTTKEQAGGLGNRFSSFYYCWKYSLILLYTYFFFCPNAPAFRRKKVIENVGRHRK